MNYRSIKQMRRSIWIELNKRSTKNRRFGKYTPTRTLVGIYRIIHPNKQLMQSSGANKYSKQTLSLPTKQDSIYLNDLIIDSLL